MSHASSAAVLGAAGVTLLLVAFFLNLIKALRSDGWLYLLMNLVGATLSCYSSYLIRFPPFVVLEGTWAAVAALGLARKLRVSV
jgi:hypothetical protein